MKNRRELCELTMNSAQIKLMSPQAAMDIIEGLYVYSKTIIPGTKVVSITGDIVTVDREMTSTGAHYVIYSELNPAAFGEYLSLVEELKIDYSSSGTLVKFNFRTEDQIVRNRMKDIVGVSDDGFFSRATVIMNPSQRQFERSGITEFEGGLVTIPMSEFFEKGLEFEDIETELCSININGTKYNINEKARTTPYANTHLLYTFSIKEC